MNDAGPGVAQAREVLGVQAAGHVARHQEGLAPRHRVQLAGRVETADVERDDVQRDAIERVRSERQLIPAVSPTIVENTLTLEFGLASALELEFELYDINGQRVESLGSAHYDSGLHSRSFVLDELASGVYFAAMRSHDDSRIARFVVR